MSIQAKGGLPVSTLDAGAAEGEQADDAQRDEEQREAGGEGERAAQRLLGGGQDQDDDADRRGADRGREDQRGDFEEEVGHSPDPRAERPYSSGASYRLSRPRRAGPLAQMATSR